VHDTAWERFIRALSSKKEIKIKILVYKLTKFTKKIYECGIKQAEKLTQAIFRQQDLRFIDYGLSLPNRVITEEYVKENLLELLNGELDFSIPPYLKTDFGLIRGPTLEGSAWIFDVSDYDGHRLNNLSTTLNNLSRVEPKVEDLMHNWFYHTKGQRFSLKLMLSKNDIQVLKNKGVKIDQSELIFYVFDIPTFLINVSYDQIAKDPDLGTEVLEGLKSSSFKIIESVTGAVGDRDVYLGDEYNEQKNKTNLKFATDEYKACLNSI
jgi:hypothetical protein